MHEVASSIRKVLAERYTSSFWLKAEMNKLNHYSQSGHCHPELLEKRDGQVVAQMRANLWRADYQRVNKNFIEVLKEPLKDGIKIMMEASIQFDPMYGLSLRIHDIDPSYSLGELEREKQETLERLQKENLLQRNKQRVLPLLPQRIAVISVETSKGYADFLNVLGSHPAGYRFFHHLFPALLQGDKSVESITLQLERIRKVEQHFDAVVIVRGGGGDVGLASYNNYQLARAIALFPLPVLTGIGHSTNLTVSEMVSFRHAITPTELADFFIQSFESFQNQTNQASESVIQWARQQLGESAKNLEHEARILVASVKHLVLDRKREHQHLWLELRARTASLKEQHMYILRNAGEQIKRSATSLVLSNSLAAAKLNEGAQRAIRSLVSDHDKELSQLEARVRNLDPVNVLRRGFSITLADGIPVLSVENLKRGQEITTRFADGEVASTIDTIKKEIENE